MAVGALFGIKPIGSDAKHVVALDADFVEDRADFAAGLTDRLRAGRMLIHSSIGDGLGRHGQILARRGTASIETLRHPREGATHPLSAGDGGFGEWANTNTKRNEYVESRAALARMSCLGANLTGVKQATDK